MKIEDDSHYPVQKIEIYINNSYITTLTENPYTFSFTPNLIGSIQPVNTLKIVLTDSVFNKKQKETTFSVEVQ